MPPSHGGAIVGTIMSDSELKKLWRTELNEMRDRINGMRDALVDRLDAAGHTGFQFIRTENGMFSFLGISEKQVQRLRDEFAIYIVGSTRMNIAGLTTSNIDYFANSLVTVLES